MLCCRSSQVRNERIGSLPLIGYWSSISKAKLVKMFARVKRFPGRCRPLCTPSTQPYAVQPRSVSFMLSFIWPPEDRAGPRLIFPTKDGEEYVIGVGPACRCRKRYWQPELETSLIWFTDQRKSRSVEGLDDEYKFS